MTRWRTVHGWGKCLGRGTSTEVYRTRVYTLKKLHGSGLGRGLHLCYAEGIVVHYMMAACQTTLKFLLNLYLHFTFVTLFQKESLIRTELHEVNKLVNS